MSVFVSFLVVSGRAMRSKELACSYDMMVYSAYQGAKGVGSRGHRPHCFSASSELSLQTLPAVGQLHRAPAACAPRRMGPTSWFSYICTPGELLVDERGGCIANGRSAASGSRAFLSSFAIRLQHATPLCCAMQCTPGELLIAELGGRITNGGFCSRACTLERPRDFSSTFIPSVLIQARALHFQYRRLSVPEDLHLLLMGVAANEATPHELGNFVVACDHPPNPRFAQSSGYPTSETTLGGQHSLPPPQTPDLTFAGITSHAHDNSAYGELHQSALSTDYSVQNLYSTTRTPDPQRSLAGAAFCPNFADMGWGQNDLQDIHCAELWRYSHQEATVQEQHCHYMSLSAPNLADTDIVYGDFGFHAAHQVSLDVSSLYSRSKLSFSPLPAEPTTDAIHMEVVPVGSALPDTQYPPQTTVEASCDATCNTNASDLDINQPWHGHGEGLCPLDEPAGEPTFTRLTSSFDALILVHFAIHLAVLYSCPAKQNSTCAFTLLANIAPTSNSSSGDVSLIPEQLDDAAAVSRDLMEFPRPPGQIEHSEEAPSGTGQSAPIHDLVSASTSRSPGVDLSIRKICSYLALRLELEKPFTDLHTYEKRSGVVYILGLEAYALWLRQRLMSANITPPDFKPMYTRSRLSHGIVKASSSSFYYFIISFMEDWYKSNQYALQTLQNEENHLVSST
ncbi:hypothetical protein NM688_g2715 [Phlebia brevispora]|uniref:Uncharacterized protein n=1 Tax=Phlebia brevispora TaxID=194682 RepID=A0ACC1T8H2_9APHY|nr:hypothetical protein NM688_g2715 [Phlebia brevispora]